MNKAKESYRLAKMQEEEERQNDFHIKDIDEQINSKSYKSCIAYDPELIEA